jgi:mannose-6-phosphate isomerase-like protein (cupin superfamily)
MSVWTAEVHDAAAIDGHVIAPGDSVRLGVIRRPHGSYDASVLFEVWEPGGAQPPNSHPHSVETFWFLAGEGVATSDGVETPVRAGQLLVLPPGSLHHIRNTGEGRLYAITTMTPDDGFAALVERGPLAPFDPDDLAVLDRAGPAT